ncbi:MAG: hypothetical protein ACI8VE_000596, partial [Natrialbaceae archaeon]
MEKSVGCGALDRFGGDRLLGIPADHLLGVATDHLDLGPVVLFVALPARPKNQFLDDPGSDGPGASSYREPSLLVYCSQAIISDCDYLSIFG